MDPPVRPKKARVRFTMDKNTALINEVKKFPTLYDSSNPDYYILGERNNAWLQVASNFNEPVDHCYTRWRSLRKRYAKERRKIHEVFQGQRKPWPLFPKMSFLAAALDKPRPLSQRKLKAEKVEANKQIPFDGPDDDVLILDANDQVIRTCKSVELSEEDEYIYETLDDPDSALEIMDTSTVPNLKPKAIRSGGAASLLGSRVKSGRIRKLTPKMQNSIIAKKLKQAQEILQASEANSNSKKTQLKKENIKPSSPKKHIPITLQKLSTETKNNNENNRNSPGGTVSADMNNHHTPTMPPSFVKVEPLNVYPQDTHTPSVQPSSPKSNNTESDPNASEASRPFKVVKLTGKNPIIFSPEQLPDIQHFLKSEALSNSDNKEQTSPTPSIKVKSVENLNQNLPPDLSRSNTNNSSSNMDIIHSVGLMRKISSKSTSRKSCGGRQYSWNKTNKNKKRRDNRHPNYIVEQRQPDSQTSDYQIEEAWNDIKQELPFDGLISPESHPHVHETPRGFNGSLIQRQQVEPLIQGSVLHKVNEAKLELIAFQRRLLEEQHRRSLEYMKKEHDMKMTLLRAEIDLKRKQLNIML